MTKKELFGILLQIANQNPKLHKEIIELAEMGRESGVQDDVLLAYCDTHPALEPFFSEQLKQTSKGRVFPVHKPFSEEIMQRIRLAQHNEHYRNWANAIKSIPEFTQPLPEVNKAFIHRAKEIWKQNICGNESILRILLQHCLEYGKTGKTRSILLVGDPGVGKTLVAKNYGKILNLPFSFIAGPSASSGRGLSGAPNVYTGAGAGIIVQSMIENKTGNPVIFIDEIEKAAGGYDSRPHFLDELLSVLDDSNVSWRDNFLEIDVDASHVPFVFTANDKSLISAPLLDRMEVVQMESPSLEMIHHISKDFTLPKALEAFGCDQIEFREQELEMLVDMLWNGGSRSCRAYQKAIEHLVREASLDVLENERVVQITEADIRKAVTLFSQKARTTAIGFIA